MRMGFVIQRWKVRNPPPYTEVERNYTQVAARGTPVYFRETSHKIWGLPFPSFHWSPRNWQVFKFSLESPYLKFSRESQIFWQVFTEVNGSPARRHLSVCLRSTSVYGGGFLICMTNPILMDRTLTSTWQSYDTHWHHDKHSWLFMNECHDDVHSHSHTHWHSHVAYDTHWHPWQTFMLSHEYVSHA